MTLGLPEFCPTMVDGWLTPLVDLIETSAEASAGRIVPLLWMLPWGCVDKGDPVGLMLEVSGSWPLVDDCCVSDDV